MSVVYTDILASPTACFLCVPTTVWCIQAQQDKLERKLQMWEALDKDIEGMYDQARAFIHESRVSTSRAQNRGIKAYKRVDEKKWVQEQVRMCIGRPFTNISGQPLVASQAASGVDFSSNPSAVHENKESNEWSALSVTEVLCLSN